MALINKEITLGDHLGSEGCQMESAGVSGKFFESIFVFFLIALSLMVIGPPVLDIPGSVDGETITDALISGDMSWTDTSEPC